MLTKDLAFYSYSDIMHSEYDELFASVLIILFVNSTDPPSPSITVHFFRLCGLWDAAKDRRKCRLLAWKDQIRQRKDKPLPGGNCKDLNI